jgi:hypothetical protein
VIVHTQIAIISTPFWNKKLNGKHCILIFIAINNVAYFVDNDPNQLHTKVKTRKENILKHITNILKNNEKCEKKRKKEMELFKLHT